MEMEQIGPLIQNLSIMALPLLFAVTLHEAAHAWVADKKGDGTARLLGRITLNPWPHVDLWGTLLMPLLFYTTIGFLFGYAKPVPVNASNLRRPKQDMAWVAAAGPGMNLFLAVASGFIYRLILLFNPTFLSSQNGFSQPGDLATLVLTPLLLMLRFSVDINLVLMVFNLIPIPPLDGGRVMVGLLPPRSAKMMSRIEPYGMILLLLMTFLDPFNLMQKTLWPLVSVLSAYISGGWVI